MNMIAPGAAVRMAARERPTRAQDLIWLTALGVAARRAVPLDAPLLAINDIAGSLWSPVTEVVTGCLREMLQAGYLELAASPEQIRTTVDGLEVLERLMAVPLPGARTSLGQVGLRIKLAHLDLAGAETRRQVLRDLIVDHQKELALARVDLGNLWAGPYGCSWFQGDAERLRRDLDLLRRLLAREAATDGDVVPLDTAR